MKRAEMGVGTLIIFISMLLVAAVAAGVLIQTTGSLQEKSLTTGQQARAQVANKIQVVEISATDGRNRTLREFNQILKLAAGSDAMKLEQIMLTFNTQSKTATLEYRGTGAPIERSFTGYNTGSEQELGAFKNYNWTNPGNIQWTWYSSGIDLDGDGIYENVTVCRDGGNICPASYDGLYLAVNISSTDQKEYVRFTDPNGVGADISLGGVLLGNNMTSVGSYGTMSTRGTTAGAWTLGGQQLILTQTPHYLEDDLDNDNLTDQIEVNNTHAIVTLSSYGEIAVPLGMDLRTPGAISVDADLVGSGTTYGNVLIQGTTTTSEQIPKDITFLVSVSDANWGKGYFVVEYLEQGNNFQDGQLQRGDLIRMHFEAPQDVGEDEEIRISLIPKSGAQTLSIFTTPSVIATQRVYLYP